MQSKASGDGCAATSETCEYKLTSPSANTSVELRQLGFEKGLWCHCWSESKKKKRTTTKIKKKKCWESTDWSGVATLIPTTSHMPRRNPLTDLQMRRGRDQCSRRPSTSWELKPTPELHKAKNCPVDIMGKLAVMRRVHSCKSGRELWKQLCTAKRYLVVKSHATLYLLHFVVESWVIQSDVIRPRVWKNNQSIFGK